MMILHKTFEVRHLLNFAGLTALQKLEQLREMAEQFISRELREEEVISIAETRDVYASSVTVWYRRS
jgi:hypothetical protein